MTPGRSSLRGMRAGLGRSLASLGNAQRVVCGVAGLRLRLRPTTPHTTLTACPRPARYVCLGVIPMRGDRLGHFFSPTGWRHHLCAQTGRNVEPPALRGQRGNRLGHCLSPSGVMRGKHIFPAPICRGRNPRTPQSVAPRAPAPLVGGAPSQPRAIPRYARERPARCVWCGRATATPAPHHTTHNAYGWRSHPLPWSRWRGPAPSRGLPRPRTPAPFGFRFGAPAPSSALPPAE